MESCKVCGNLKFALGYNFLISIGACQSLSTSFKNINRPLITVFLLSGIL
jgi:hypothetical protein